MNTDEKCRGCRDDFYNIDPAGSVLAVGGKCWHLAKATLVTRYRIGYWTEPTVPRAFTEVEVPNCYRQKGFAFYEKLPDFVKLSDVVRMTKAHAKAERP